jgi:hypothetical protein
MCNEASNSYFVDCTRRSAIQGVTNGLTTLRDSNAILFINYVSQSVAGAKSPFEKAAFLDRVFDTQFPENERYAGLLVAEVPIGQRYNVLVEAYRLRDTGNIEKLKFFFRHMFKPGGYREIL